MSQWGNLKPPNVKTNSSAFQRTRQYSRKCLKNQYSRHDRTLSMKRALVCVSTGALTDLRGSAGNEWEDELFCGIAGKRPRHHLRRR